MALGEALQSRGIFYRAAAAGAILSGVKHTLGGWRGVGEVYFFTPPILCPNPPPPPHHC